MLTAVRLVAVCIGDLGPAGCVCQVRAAPGARPPLAHRVSLSVRVCAPLQLALTLQPTWRKYSTNAKVRCEDNDAISAILDKLDEVVVSVVEPPVNDIINIWNGGVDGIEDVLCPVVDTVNSIVGGAGGFFGSIGSLFGRRLNDCLDVLKAQQLCIKTGSLPNGRPGSPYCVDEEFALTSTRCTDSDVAGGLEYTCFYHRVQTICADGGSLKEWRDLFTSGYEDFDELQIEFAEAFGDSFMALDPALQLLMEKVQESAVEGPDLEARKDICSSAAFASSMSFEQIIVSCFFAMAEGSCPTGGAEPDRCEYHAKPLALASILTTPCVVLFAASLSSSLTVLRARPAHGTCAIVFTTY